MKMLLLYFWRENSNNFGAKIQIALARKFKYVTIRTRYLRTFTAKNTFVWGLENISHWDKGPIFVLLIFRSKIKILTKKCPKIILQFQKIQILTTIFNPTKWILVRFDTNWINRQKIDSCPSVYLKDVWFMLCSKKLRGEAGVSRYTRDS